ncbi:hypothetical protein DFA_07767 [Cavenderia fasciculata]|uniref:RING-type domain-containing protein n=1 Tax=Cavenderia fasciculata TaxID=261658 RepID=F4Q367_CACFS|nr:uncharacterized protein DFA_07767 [Cavenderia fasciculata]EGG16789.1 hypothetical protein DFA_07767 [Cavenderia fasciculata]|eukprot:XP_004355263.1 hypothetical protein DFA_07767 [Cavenderia fasciculata]
MDKNTDSNATHNLFKHQRAMLHDVMQMNITLEKIYVDREDEQLKNIAQLKEMRDREDEQLKKIAQLSEMKAKQKDFYLSEINSLTIHNKLLKSKLDFIYGENLEKKDINETINLEKELKSILEKVSHYKDTKTKELQSKVNQLEDSLNCIICSDQEKRIAFLPCRHKTHCISCFDKQPPETCPLCRGKIENSMVLY